MIEQRKKKLQTGKKLAQNSKKGGCANGKRRRGRSEKSGQRIKKKPIKWERTLKNRQRKKRSKKKQNARTGKEKSWGEILTQNQKRRRKKRRVFK